MDSPHSAPALRFDGQVAIVTGAGGGIGYAIARALAERGAAVLVNDYGGDTRGSGGGEARAERAAAELRALGARAVASAHAVGSAAAAQSITQAALDAFGRVDILVNNAGIALPGLITETSDEQIEAVVSTNLLGPWRLLRAVWPVMLHQGYGRVLNTSSNAAFGIGANVPYATTKAGLLGLTADAAIEGRPHGILVNAMMPTALSRLIEQIPDPAFVDWFRRHFPADKVAAAILPLLSRECPVSGRTYAVGGGRMARVAFSESRGRTDPALAPEAVLPHFAAIEDMSEAVIIDHQGDAAALYAEHFPYAAGRAPSLDQHAVVGAGREADVP